MRNTIFDIFFLWEKNSPFIEFRFLGACTTKHRVHAVAMSHTRNKHFNTSSEKTTGRGSVIGHEFLYVNDRSRGYQQTNAPTRHFIRNAHHRALVIATTRTRLMNNYDHSPSHTSLALYGCKVLVGRTICFLLNKNIQELTTTNLCFRKEPFPSDSVQCSGRPWYIISNMTLAACVGNTKSWEVNMKDECQKHHFGPFWELRDIGVLSKKSHVMANIVRQWHHIECT